jgi:hypothetical protein
MTVEHYLSLHAINIAGLNPCDRSRIEQIGLTAWMDEVCKPSQPLHPAHKSLQIERTCAVCDKTFQASRADAAYCSDRCKMRGSRRGLKHRSQAVTIKQNRPMANKQVTTHASV